MHVLVTGATGFVGLHTAIALNRAGHHVRLGIRSEEKMRRVYAGQGIDLADHAIVEITEDTPLAQATSGYRRARADSDLFVRDLASRGAPVAITYPPTVIGPDDPGMSEGTEALAFFLNRFFMQTSGGQQFIDVRDLAHVHTRLLESRKTGRYVAAGHYLRWREYGELLERASGRSLRRRIIPGAVLRGLGRINEVAMGLFGIETFMTHENMCFATQWVVGNGARLRDELGIEYRSALETFTDSARWLVDRGHVDPR